MLLVVKCYCGFLLPRTFLPLPVVKTRFSNDTPLSFTEEGTTETLKAGKTLYTEVGDIDSVTAISVSIAFAVHFMQRKMNRNSAEKFPKSLILYA